tara:strand:- start:2564 stop:2788 length:225 start_codon:yes stop_codon:yes gene_type:complete
MSDTYNGWKNHATWNVALWIQNDEGLYNFAKECGSYKEFASLMEDFGSTHTPDQVSYKDDELDTQELNEVIQDL